MLAIDRIFAHVHMLCVAVSKNACRAQHGKNPITPVKTCMCSPLIISALSELNSLYSMHCYQSLKLLYPFAMVLIASIDVTEAAVVNPV